MEKMSDQSESKVIINHSPSLSKISVPVIISIGVGLVALIFIVWQLNKNSEVFDFTSKENLNETTESSIEATVIPEITELEDFKNELDQALFDIESTLNEVETYGNEDDSPPTL